MTIKTWSDVQAQISLHKLPYSVLRFNMSLSGVLIDTATGDTLATSVIEAKQVIEQGAASPSTLTDDDGGRTHIGNTPTCEDCEQPLDSCTCGDDESPAEHTQDSDCTPAPKPLGLQMADDIASALLGNRSTSITLSPAEVLAVDLMGKQAKAQLEKSDTEIAQSVLARPDLPVRRLTCCCCGESFQGRQFHNQDTGHGMGECCADRVLEHKPFGHLEMTLAEFERTYGVRGYHFDLPKGGA